MAAQVAVTNAVATAATVSRRFALARALSRLPPPEAYPKDHRCLGSNDIARSRVAGVHGQTRTAASEGVPPPDPLAGHFDDELIGTETHPASERDRTVAARPIGVGEAQPPARRWK
jgi:hypothetical protein